LWHLTVMVLIIGLANLLGGVGLEFKPGTGIWWASRPIWILVLAGFLMVFVAIFGRFEQMAKGAAAAPLPAWRAIVGAGSVCPGLAVLALTGIGSEGVLGIRIIVIILVLAGAFLVLWSPGRRKGVQDS
jgi:hypothetical protein